MKLYGIRKKVILHLFRFAAIIVVITGGMTAHRYYQLKIGEYQYFVYGYLHAASNMIDGDRIEGYLESGTPDAYYDEVLRYLTVTRDAADIRLFYVFVPYEDDLVYIWQTDDAPYEWLGYHEQYMIGGKETRDKTFRKDPVEEIRFYNDATYGDIACGFYPLFNSAGEPVALIGMDLSAPDIRTNILRFNLSICGIMLIGTIIAGRIYYTSLSKKIVNPLKRLNNAARKFTSDLDNDDVPDINIHTGDEIEELSDSFLKMYGDIRRYITENARISEENGRIESELNVATRIQADMLPRIFPPFPDRHEFDIYATMNPAKEVGGDFYDFFFVDETHLALVIADVSGKGVPAALFMVIAKTLIKDRAQLGASPAKVLEYANEQLLEGDDSQLFVTVWLAIIDVTTGKGVAANAGHEYPALRHRDGSFELVKYKHSVAVSAFPGISFLEHEFELLPGDVLYVYTDGVPEAKNADNEMFRTERMLEALNRRKDANPEQLLRNVKEEIDAFVGDAPQFDDITMLAVAWKGNGTA